MKKLNIMLFITMLISVSVNAEIIEKWDCIESYKPNSPVLVKANINTGRTTGSIEVAGVVHNTEFQIAGFDRRWDFGLKNKIYTYSFVVQPNGEARYFDFSVSNKAYMLLSCSEVK